MERVRSLILRSLATRPGTMWDLVIDQNSQHQVFTDALRALRAEGAIDCDQLGTMMLTPSGWTEAKSQSLDGWRDHSCPQCHGRGVVIDNFDTIEEQYRRLCDGRPSAITEYDQGVVPPDVALARVALLDQRGDLAGKDILIVGDDDLMCLAFMLTGLPRSIVVLEIDERINAFLRPIVAARQWNVDVIDYDVREPLPTRLCQQFDVFFTDPVETVAGIGLFLSRCAQSLRGAGAAGYFGLTHLESGWRKWLEVERDLLKMNMVISDVHRDFNSYNFLGPSVMSGQMKIVSNAPVTLPPPERLWFSSTLFRLEVVTETKPLVTGAVDWGRELYADEDTI